MAIPDDLDEDAEPRIDLHVGSIDMSRQGYVNVVPSDSFVQIDPWKWASHEPVQPLEVIQIDPGSTSTGYSMKIPAGPESRPSPPTKNPHELIRVSNPRMPKERFELSRAKAHCALNTACLPVPPLRHHILFVIKPRR